MTIRWLQGLAALLLAGMVFALPAAAISSHSHPEGASQSCALCHSVHLPGFMPAVTGMSRPVHARPVQSTAAVAYEEVTSSAPSNRGPPADARTP